jgi:hypothetical protein
MPSLAGALLSGAAVGYGQADDKNVTTHNTQAMSENINEERAAVEDMYEQAKEQRHIAQGRAAAKYTSGIINTQAQKELSAQGLHMPDPDHPTPGQADDASVADMATQREALNLAAAKTGFLDTKTQAETSSKEDITLAKVAGQAEVAKILGQLRVLSEKGRGSDAAAIAADAKNTLTAVSQERDLYKVLADVMASPAAKASAQKQLDQLHSGGALPSTAPGALSSGSTNDVDTLFPVKQ